MKKLINSNLVASELFVTRPKFIVLIKRIRTAWMVRITNHSNAELTYNWVVFNSVLLFLVFTVQSSDFFKFIARMAVLPSAHRF